MSEMERLKRVEEAEPMAVLVMKDWKSCAGCGFKDYPKYREGPVCFLTYRDIKLYCDANLKPRDCPLHEAIGIIEPNGHLAYFRETTDPRPCVARGIEPAENKEPCIGYGIREDDDEPCEMCKQCLICDGNGEVEA